MATILFGDADKNPALTQNKKGKNQTLIGTDNDSINIIFGDVGFMFNSSKGGNDKLHGGNNTAGTLINASIGDAALMYNFAKGGNDSLQGGDNSGTALINSLSGDAALMFDSTRGGNDALLGGNNMSGVLVNALAGDTAVMFDAAKGGNDTLRGGNNIDGKLTNIMVGDAIAMLNNAKGGNDELWGGDNNGAGSIINHLYGDARYMDNSAQAGNDVLISGSNATDHMYGDGKYLISNDSSVLQDILKIIEMFTLIPKAPFASADPFVPTHAFGTNSPDRFNTIMDSLNKILSNHENLTFAPLTSGGADTFVFNDYFGDDYIHDFRQSDGDEIVFKVAGVNAFDDLTIDDNGSNTIIKVEGHGILTLVGVTGVDLSGDINFIV